MLAATAYTTAAGQGVDRVTGSRLDKADMCYTEEKFGRSEVRSVRLFCAVYAAAPGGAWRTNDPTIRSQS